MTVKEQLYNLIDQLPPDQLPRALELIQQLNVSSGNRKERFTVALQDSLKENAELYTRLADA
ncbi:hypothetical protein H6F89_33910 [Cyanobacteria bacterium FACHB-63]|nr:hypothetical protein [Cyanobacteria bacterium FACHB-63]